MVAAVAEPAVVVHETENPWPGLTGLGDGDMGRAEQEARPAEPLGGRAKPWPSGYPRTAGRA